MRKILLFMILLAGFSFASSGSYFQQKVNYTISAELNKDSKTISAREQLVYKNNSPDTLKTIYFNLYMNRFRSGAPMPGGVRDYTSAWIALDTVMAAGKIIESYFINNTLMKLPLESALAPGDSITFYFTFVLQLPYADTRFGHVGNHFDVGNWYVTPVVYDRDGWHLNQHIENEFYQEWGDFSIDITVPSGFILGATGNLMNEAEVMQDTSRAVRRSLAFESDDPLSTTTWKFRANNVHDFAWTADPNYKIIDYQQGKTRIRFLVMKQNYDAWKKHSGFINDCLIFFNQRFTEYPYEQVTIADTYITAGGIEYPQIVLINTYSSPAYALPYWRAVVVHELAHQWFYGLLGSNQTEDEWLDEGFTAFAEIIAMEHLFGRFNNYGTGGDGWLTRNFDFHRDDRQYTALDYLRWTKAGRELDPIDTPPDLFRGQAYTSQYHKMAMVLAMLRDVLGEEKFWHAMRSYCREWRGKHPGTADMKRAFSRASGEDLDWFWEQWLHSTKQWDVAVSSVKEEQGIDSVNVHVTLKNKDAIFMPFDLLLVDVAGDSSIYRVTHDPFFQPREDRVYLPAWRFGQKEYRAKLPIAKRLRYVEADPFMKLQDVNRLNNLKGTQRTHVYFMRRQSFAPPLDGYMWELWPTLFYNVVDKVKIGSNWQGNYINSDHLISAQFWYNSAPGDADFDLKYRNPVRFIHPKLFQQWRFFEIDGHSGQRFSLSFNDRADMYYRVFLQKHALHDARYPSAPWQKGSYSSIGFEWGGIKSPAETGKGLEWQLNLKNSLTGSKTEFSKVALKLKGTIYSEYWDYRLSVQGRFGVATTGTPLQEQFNLAGANGMEEFDEALYRSAGTLPLSWERNGNLYLPVGAGVRGAQLSGNSLASKLVALSTEFYFPGPLALLPFRFLNSIETRIFADYGTAFEGPVPDLNTWYRSAGLALSYDQFYTLNRIFGINSIELSMPLWLYYPGIEKELKWRWQLYFDFDLESSPLF